MVTTILAGGLRNNGAFAGAVNDLPLVSVITVVRNGAATLEQAIRSVVEQDYPNLEYIIVDGGSDDGSIDIIRRWEHRITYWCSEPDEGIYNAWNKGVALATGEWIAFLGADDELKPHAISAYVDWIKSFGEGELDYISSRVRLQDKGGKCLRVIGHPWKWPEFQRYMTTAHVGSLHHRRLYQRYGRYDESYRICGDYEFLLRAGPTLRTGFMDRITAVMEAGGISNSGSAALSEQRRAKVKTGGRAGWLANVEYIDAIAKFYARRLLQRLM